MFSPLQSSRFRRSLCLYDACFCSSVDGRCTDSLSARFYRTSILANSKTRFMFVLKSIISTAFCFFAFSLIDGLNTGLLWCTCSICWMMEGVGLTRSKTGVLIGGLKTLVLMELTLFTVLTEATWLFADSSLGLNSSRCLAFISVDCIWCESRDSFQMNCPDDKTRLECDLDFVFMLSDHHYVTYL